MHFFNNWTLNLPNEGFKLSLITNADAQLYINALTSKYVYQMKLTTIDKVI